MTSCFWCKREFIVGVGAYCSHACFEIASHWPTCAVCSKWVDEMTRNEDKLEGTVTYVVACHREREVVTIPIAQLVAANGMAFATAFANALPPPASAPTTEA
jgi:hypothetical protein